MLAETEALPLGFVAIVCPDDLWPDGPDLLSGRAAVVTGDGWSFSVAVPRGSLRPVQFDRAAGLLESWAGRGTDMGVAAAGYPSASET